MAYYALTYIKFDNSYSNGCFFSNSSVREEALLPENYNTIKKYVNFNFGNILNTTIVVNRYHKENYCIIEHDNTKYYYFVTNANYLSHNQWKLSLELDVISQYLTGADNKTFSNCYIERGHCDRWTQNGNKVKFNVSRETLLCNREFDIDTPNVDRRNVNLNTCKYTIINNWVRDNVLCWQYLFIDLKHRYNVTGWQGSVGNTIVPSPYTEIYNNYNYSAEQATINCDYSVICIPVYKNKNKKIYFYDIVNHSKIFVDEDGLFNYYITNNETSYVHNIKFSMVPPVNFSNLRNISDVSIINDNLMILSTTTIDGGIKKGVTDGYYSVDCFGDLDYEHDGTVITNVVRHGCFVNVWQQFKTMYSETINTNLNYEFNVADVKGNRNKNFEPKILNDCYKLTIRDSSNGEYKYNPLHLNKQNVTAMYTEGINVTNNNYYYRLESSGIVSNSYMWDWHGIVNTVDYSLTVANDNIASFLANNKNFLLTRSASIATPLISNLLAGPVASTLSAAGAIAKTYIDWDNMENRVNSLRNTNDGATLNILVNDGLKLYLDIEKAFDFEIEKYYNFIYNYGYKIQRIENPINYINSRKYFNYVQFKMEEINIEAPTIIKDKLRNIFNNGIRLWNDYSNIYNYTKENYENYL